MYIPHKSIRLILRCQNYLFLIKQANDRYKDKKETLRIYDAAKDPYVPVRLMYTRVELESKVMRCQALSNWLAFRYSDLVDQLIMEDQEQIKNVVTSIETTLSKSELKESTCVIKSQSQHY